MKHADDLQAVSVDEALIEVTASVEAAKNRAASIEGNDAKIMIIDNRDHAKELAELIREQVKSTTGCTGAFRQAPQ
jgi:DNA repair protein REV1